MLLGIDTGGTFTDFVCFDGQRLRFHKVLSTPDDPSRAILQGISELELETKTLHLVHGSTVATNAILERKGVRTLLVTQSGMEELLAIGRQTRNELYNLCPDPVEEWLSRSHCFGIGGRIDCHGNELQPLSGKELKQLAGKACDYESVAVCMLFSFMNPGQEQAIEAALPEGPFVSLSHRVLAEYREYERASTTFLNAYVGPLVQRYLTRLVQSIEPRHLFVMHSAGGVMEAEEAGAHAVRMVLSGPAGGLVAAQAIGEQLQQTNLLTFDMGGTSTDVALIQGKGGLTTEGKVAGLPVAVPMLDIHTIGAGGGSLAWLDGAGLPQVGPESAGASPGPVCYGKGGEQPTVTDANLVLGRLPMEARLGGSMALDIGAAREALESFGKALGMGAEEAAAGIVAIAEEHMAGALRVVSVQRGHDPQAFALLCFGGAGGLHACALAKKLGMRQVILPVGSGAFSALGMLAGRRQVELSRSYGMRLDAPGARQRIASLFEELEAEATARMPGLNPTCEYRLDLRYLGQGFHLTLDLAEDLAMQLQQFHAAHELAYGHRLQRPVELITLRLTAYADTEPVTLPELDAAERKPEPCGESEVYGAGRVPHLRRELLRPGHLWSGPALVLEDTATLWLPHGWQLEVSPHGHLLLTNVATGDAE